MIGGWGTGRQVKVQAAGGWLAAAVRMYLKSKYIDNLGLRHTFFQNIKFSVLLGTNLDDETSWAFSDVGQVRQMVYIAHKTSIVGGSGCGTF
jgi:hypothetical protein